MTSLDPSKAQVLLVEMQAPIVASSRTVEEAALRKAAATLLSIARHAGLPVTASIVALGDEEPKLIEEIDGVAPMIRSTIGALDDTAIAARIASSDRGTLLIGGVSSEIAVVHTVLQARAAGYAVQVPLDLCGGLDARTEGAALQRMWSAGAVPTSVSTFATSLFEDMASNLGGQVMQTLDRHWGWSGGV